MIPDYDRVSQPSPIPSKFHGDIEVTSDILKLHLSFQWRPVIDNIVIDRIRHWATDSQTDRPHLTVIGKFYCTNIHSYYRLIFTQEIFIHDRYSPVAHVTIRRRRPSNLPEETQEIGSIPRPVGECQPSHLAQSISYY